MTLGRAASSSLLLLVLAGFAAPLLSQQPTVHIEPGRVDGPRPLAAQTRAAVIKDYLQAWQIMRDAFSANQAAVLDSAFVGSAREELADAIAQQNTLGIRTHYQDRAHDLRIVFYSPEGLSVELTDTVDYDLEVIGADGKSIATTHQTAHYIAVLTPSEIRWRVRVFQSGEAPLH